MEEKKEVNLPDIIRERRILPYEKKQNIMYNIFYNCLIFMIMVVITLIINISFNKFLPEDFKSYIDIIRIGCGAISIVVLEFAFRKDSTKLWLHGAEILIFSICVLFVPYIYIPKNRTEFLKYTIICFGVYYILKSFITSYLRKNLSDVKEIVKEEKESYIDEESTKTLKEQKIENEKRKKAKEVKTKSPKKVTGVSKK